MSPNELLASHTARQLVEWQEYFNWREVDRKQREQLD